MKLMLGTLLVATLIAGSAQAASSRNPCGRWDLSVQQSRECRSAWTNATSDAEREKVEMRFKPRPKYPENINDPRRPNWVGASR